MRVIYETKLGAPDRDGFLFWEDLPHILKPFALENMGTVQIEDDQGHMRDVSLEFHLVEGGEGKLVLKLK